MKTFIFYDGSSGEIKGFAAGDIVASGDHHMIESSFFSADDYYVNLTNLTVVQRPSMTTVVNKSQIKADSTEEAIISNVMLGSTCYHDDQTIVMDEQIINFTADHPGVYDFRFEKFPYKPVIISLEAVSS